MSHPTVIGIARPVTDFPYRSQVPPESLTICQRLKWVANGKASERPQTIIVPGRYRFRLDDDAGDWVDRIELCRVIIRIEIQQRLARIGNRQPDLGVLG